MTTSNAQILTFKTIRQILNTVEVCKFYKSTKNWNSFKHESL